MDTNVVVISGKLGTSVDYKKLDNSDRRVAHFDLISEYINKDKNTNKDNRIKSIINCETWDKIADNCNTYLNKGSKVSIVGYLKQDNREIYGSQNFNRLKIVAHQVIFTDRD